jgi:hypothetical protein
MPSEAAHWCVRGGGELEKFAMKNGVGVLLLFYV